MIESNCCLTARQYSPFDSDGAERAAEGELGRPHQALPGDTAGGLQWPALEDLALGSDLQAVRLSGIGGSDANTILSEDAQGNLLLSVSLRVAFDLVSSEDGSTHVIETFGEALDGGDKATNKAMSAAFKYAILQAFCIPVVGRDDADARSYRLKRSDIVPEPDQGWEQWQTDILEIVRVCETQEALDRLQGNYRGLLKALSTQRPTLYSSIGEAVQGRRRSISNPPAKRAKPKSNGSGKPPSESVPAVGSASHG